MFPGFKDEMINVGEVRLRVRWAGDGPALLLIHGHPRTAATWHKVAPALVDLGYTVVCPDMRGYGGSDAAEVQSDHSQQSKRQVAADLAFMMRELGIDRYVVAGHDRGCYVGMRMALDHSSHVRGYCALDGVPISDALSQCDVVFATEWFHWFFFAQPDKPERAINADPMAWYGESRKQMGSANYEELASAVSDPNTVLAMLEDYRAGLGVDFDLERLDREQGRKIECPMLFVWAAKEDMTHLYGDPIEIWSRWCEAVEPRPIDSTHHMSEEAPDELVDALHSFVSGIDA